MKMNSTATTTATALQPLAPSELHEVDGGAFSPAAALLSPSPDARGVVAPGRGNETAIIAILIG